MTREEYKSQRLGAKIGELTNQIADLEFMVQYLNEENAKLKTENGKLSEENACFRSCDDAKESKSK